MVSEPMRSSWIPVAIGLLLGCSRPAPTAASTDAALSGGVPTVASSEAVPATSSPAPEAESSESSAPVSSADAGKPAVHGLYGTRASIRLTQATHGIDGALRVLEDTRARAKGPDGPLVMREAEGWLHARLELLDPSGSPIDARELWTSLADARPAGELGGTFFLTLDPECFASKFCGPDTEMVEVTSGKLVQVTSVDAETGKTAPIRLRDSIVSGWRTVPAERGTGFEIFQVAGALTATGFVTAYVRYTLEDRVWIKRYKQRAEEDPPGNPGNEEAAFARAKFPALPPR
jgi:hypothetical protein